MNSYMYINLKELQYSIKILTKILKENGTKIFITHSAQTKRSLDPLSNIICNQLACL